MVSTWNRGPRMLPETDIRWVLNEQRAQAFGPICQVARQIIRRLLRGQQTLIDDLICLALPK